MDSARVLELYRAGHGGRAIARITGDSVNTVMSFLQREKGRAALRGEKLERGTPAPAPTASQEPRRATAPPPATNGGADIKADILAALKKPNGLDKEQFTTAHNISERVLEAHVADLRDGGYCIDQQGAALKLMVAPPAEPTVVEKSWNNERTIRFGLLGDTQINSKYTQLTHLHTAYRRFKQEGISTVYHTGDIDEGEQMRPGHQYECYSQGADDHVSEIVRVYPCEARVVTEFLTGNHDHSLIKLAGYDIGRAIAAARPDMRYLGPDQAFINLTPNCTLELRHPGGGTAYAKSYKVQKMIEQMSGGEKPNILAVGHYHKYLIDFYRNVHAIQTACLQAQTPWMRGQGIAADMGFLIIEIDVNDDGSIDRFKPEFFPFYKAIKDDYKNFQ